MGTQNGLENSAKKEFGQILMKNCIGKL